MATASDTQSKTTKKKRTTSTSTTSRTRRATKSTAKAPTTNGGPSQEQIAERAWFIWQEQGCPSGKDEENWLQAEKELSASK